MENWRDDLLQGTADAPTMMGGPAAADETQLAWSGVQDYPDTGYEPVGHSVGSAALTAALAVLAVLAGTLTVALLYTSRSSPPAPAVTTPTTVTAAAAQDPDVVPPTSTRPIPPSAARAETPDDLYLRLFAEQSTLIVSDPVPIIAFGHAQCDYLSRPGSTLHSATTAIADKYKDVTPQMAYGIVMAAVTAYCPWEKP